MEYSAYDCGEFLTHQPTVARDRNGEEGKCREEQMMVVVKLFKLCGCAWFVKRECVGG